jgi:hypothetical protein
MNCHHILSFQTTLVFFYQFNRFSQITLLLTLPHKSWSSAVQLLFQLSAQLLPFLAPLYPAFYIHTCHLLHVFYCHCHNITFPTLPTKFCFGKYIFAAQVRSPSIYYTYQVPSLLLSIHHLPPSAVSNPILDSQITSYTLPSFHYHYQ